MLENCTPGAIKVIVVAQEETRRLRQDTIGPEQLLLGLITEESGSAAKILKAAGVKFQVVQTELEKTSRPSAAAAVPDLPFSASSQSVLEIARTEAKRLGSDSVGSEHILLGVLQQGDNRAVEILRSLGLDIRRLRSQVEQMAQYAPKEEPVPQRFLMYSAFVEKANDLKIKAQEECLRSASAISGGGASGGASGGGLIGSEHYLVAMVANRDFLGGDPLRKKGITPERVKIAIAETFPPEPHSDASSDQILNRFELCCALQQAFADATSMQEMVGTAHIMLAMINQRNSRAKQILSKLNVDLRELTNELNELLASKRDEVANLGQTLGATVKSLMQDLSETRKPLPPKFKLDVDELLAIIDYEQGNLNEASTRLQQLILYRAGDQSAGGDDRMRRLQHHLALVYIKQERYEEAQSALERSLKIHFSATQSADLARAGLLNNLGWLFMLQGRTAEARPYLEQAISIVAGSTDTQFRAMLAQVQNNLGDCRRAEGDLDGANALLQSSLDTQTRLLAPDDPQLAYNHINVGKLLMDMGRLPESRSSFAKALALQELSLNPGHPDVAYTLKEYVPLLEKLNLQQQAAAARDRIEAIRSKYAQPTRA